jgi:hypothetical protein
VRPRRCNVTLPGVNCITGRAVRRGGYLNGEKHAQKAYQADSEDMKHVRAHHIDAKHYIRHLHKDLPNLI